MQDHPILAGASALSHLHSLQTIARCLSNNHNLCTRCTSAVHGFFSSTCILCSQIASHAFYHRSTSAQMPENSQMHSSTYEKAYRQ